MSKLYVVSTLTATQVYAGWDSGPNNLPKIKRQVTVKGGANLPDKHLITPQGVYTEITDEEEAFLRNHPVFKVHEKNGFVKIESRKGEVEKSVSDMVGRDQSAPLVPQDYEGEEVKPSTGKKKK